jgi:hypothetical protein
VARATVGLYQWVTPLAVSRGAHLGGWRNSSYSRHTAGRPLWCPGRSPSKPKSNRTKRTVRPRRNSQLARRPPSIRRQTGHSRPGRQVSVQNFTLRRGAPALAYGRFRIRGLAVAVYLFDTDRLTLTCDGASLGPAGQVATAGNQVGNHTMLLEYIREYGPLGLITDPFSPVRGYLADALRWVGRQATAQRINPQAADYVLPAEWRPWRPL